MITNLSMIYNNVRRTNFSENKQSESKNYAKLYSL